ncbi:MAG: hypothetical protein H7039_19665 [Bryobacteraceae bacterium]|nr:hypothetical protein [Bryobacteraceae bacterium]
MARSRLPSPIIVTGLRSALEIWLEGEAPERPETSHATDCEPVDPNFLLVSLSETPTHHACGVFKPTVAATLLSFANVSPRAVIRVSGPKLTCNSPTASIRASRAFARAICMASPCAELRREILERVNRPTAITVSRIMRDKVTISAKPFARVAPPRWLEV